MERKFMSLGQPRSFKEYQKLDQTRFEFSSFDSQIERLALAWKGEGDFSSRLIGYMERAPFVGNLTAKDYSQYPETVLFSPQEIVTHPILVELLGGDALLSLAEMLHKGYRGGLSITTQFKKGHPKPEFVVPALGTNGRKLVFYLDRCCSAEAYSLLFEKGQ